MATKKLDIYTIEDIEKTPEKFVHNNAFIKPNGDIFIAKGYTGMNPSHQLESSALSIGRNEFGNDFPQKFKRAYERLIKEEQNLITLYYLRTILVHYYGYALFCRKEIIKAFDDRNKYVDCSLVPNPDYFGRNVTDKQLSVMEELYDVNDDGTLHPIIVNGEWDYVDMVFTPSHNVETKEEYSQYILSKKCNKNLWHI